MGKGIRTAPRDALIANSVSEKDRAKAFSFHRALDNLGALVGPLIAMIILSIFNNNIRMVFLLSTIPGLMVLILLFFVKESDTYKNNSKVISLKELLSMKKFSGKLRFLFITLFIFTLGNSSDAFIIYRLKVAGVNTVYIPLLWGIFNLIKSLGNYPSGIIADNMGKKRIIITGWILYAIIYVLFGIVNSMTGVITVFLIYGLYYSMTEGAERAYIADLVPAELRGSAYGFYNFVIGISALPASLLFGYIWEKFSYKAAFFTGSAFSLLAIILFLVTQDILSSDNKER